MDIEAKPTEYAGVLFRSKLEATWARFFDVIGVEWEYEPTNLPGWVPDFLIGGWWLAEVKPLAVTGPWAAQHKSFNKAIQHFDTVLLGDGPSDALGLLVRRIEDGLFVRNLMVDFSGKNTALKPSSAMADIFSSHLTAIWRGTSESMGAWRGAAVSAPDQCKRVSVPL